MSFNSVISGKTLHTRLMRLAAVAAGAESLGNDAIQNESSDKLDEIADLAGMLREELHKLALEISDSSD